MIFQKNSILSTKGAHNLNIFNHFYVFYLLCENKFVQCLSTGSSFQIEITRNVDFCENEPCFRLLIFVTFESFTTETRDDKNFFFDFICEKLEQRIIVP